MKFDSLFFLTLVLLVFVIFLVMILWVKVENVQKGQDAAIQRYALIGCEKQEDAE